MKSQVLLLARQGIVDSSFIGLDSTPIVDNTSQNNLKSFLANKFKPGNLPKTDKDYKLSVHTASNQSTFIVFLYFNNTTSYYTLASIIFTLFTILHDTSL